MTHFPGIGLRGQGLYACQRGACQNRFGQNGFSQNWSCQNWFSRHRHVRGSLGSMTSRNNPDNRRMGHMP